MKKYYLIGLVAVAMCSCGSNSSNSSNNDDSNTTTIEETQEQTVVEEVEEAVEASEPKVVDFIRGGNTYIGLEVKDNAGLNGNEHAETTYTIQCYNDGTMIWNEKCNYGNGYERNVEGTWRKNSGSKYDNEYTWYELWGTLYGARGGSSNTMLGFVDEQGRLYDKFATDDPVMAIHNNKSVCQLSIK